MDLNALFEKVEDLTFILQNIMDPIVLNWNFKDHKILYHNTEDVAVNRPK